MFSKCELHQCYQQEPTADAASSTRHPHPPYTSRLSNTLSLAIGSPLSALSTCVAKITAINAKHGPFDACVLVGDVFAEGSDGSEVSGLKCA